MKETLNLKKEWESLKKENPRLRIKDAAKQLNVSELELLATNIGDSAILLKGDWKELIKEIPSLGKVMALTRNESVVHEKKGVYGNISFGRHNMGTVLAEDIDLRLFMSNWHFGLAVEVKTPRGLMKSFQFFDEFGTAVHKIYLLEDSNIENYENIIEKYRADLQNEELNVIRKVENKTNKDEDLDVPLLIEKWSNMKDTHDFHGMLHSLKISRMSALRNVGNKWAYQIDNESVKKLLDVSAQSSLDIMAFVGNRGCLQIHTGQVKNIRPLDNWLNVMDPDFNLHIDMDTVNETWVVKKPTTDGIVTSVELYDEKENNILLFFGKRKPGLPENDNWRDLVNNL